MRHRWPPRLASSREAAAGPRRVRPSVAPADGLLRGRGGGRRSFTTLTDWRGKAGIASDAYRTENQFLADKLAEAESVAARKATLLDPTSERETVQVLRRRLFSSVDQRGAAEVVEAYRSLWAKHAAELPPQKLHDDRVTEFLAGYPFHPALMEVLTDKLSTLANFQRVRGMLRLVTHAVGLLWSTKPGGTCGVHLHHLDPGFGPTRSEIVTRLELAALQTSRCETR